ncbi:hypothetical protein NDU88_003237 [Pleurodeles waltl]|uniref:Uncharacterized protein n=1 Tax=Pleurodeles waltl TaxID=8319 RepID=A0AAV7UD56_PLEWA|nr:hypothetical protein NDU88_003237 [Pleurodeles waltl]
MTADASGVRDGAGLRAPVTGSKRREVRRVSWRGDSHRGEPCHHTASPLCPLLLSPLHRMLAAAALDAAHLNQVGRPNSYGAGTGEQTRCGGEAGGACERA